MTEYQTHAALVQSLEAEVSRLRAINAELRARESTSLRQRADAWMAVCATLREAVEEAPQSAAAGKDDSLRSDALRTLSFCAGLKAGWNFCVSGDDAGFERAKSQSSEALRVLRAERESPAAEQEPVAWMTKDAEASPSMLFFDHAEALQYCDDEDAPCPLFTAPKPTRQPLTDKQIASACFSYRHDFGLLSKQEQESIIFQAREWERALEKEREIGGKA